jgi:hypothetical protein
MFISMCHKNTPSLIQHNWTLNENDGNVQAMGCSASCKPCKPLCGSPGDDYSVNFGGGEALPTEDADEGEEQPAELDQESKGLYAKLFDEKFWLEKKNGLLMLMFFHP